MRGECLKGDKGKDPRFLRNFSRMPDLGEASCSEFFPELMKFLELSDPYRRE
jgi:hypothetical protein